MSARRGRNQEYFCTAEGQRSPVSRLGANIPKIQLPSHRFIILHRSNSDSSISIDENNLSDADSYLEIIQESSPFRVNIVKEMTDHVEDLKVTQRKIKAHLKRVEDFRHLKKEFFRDFGIALPIQYDPELERRLQYLEVVGDLRLQETTDYVVVDALKEGRQSDGEPEEFMDSEKFLNIVSARPLSKLSREKKKPKWKKVKQFFKNMIKPLKKLFKSG